MYTVNSFDLVPVIITLLHLFLIAFDSEFWSLTLCSAWMIDYLDGALYKNLNVNNIIGIN